MTATPLLETRSLSIAVGGRALLQALEEERRRKEEKEM